ncbi:efflux RND transporter periplasmic adaptor subunit [Thalassospira marina]|nr:efflux RND transporter periplasmic adaptor subunit [Thalassospira marina]
MSRMVRLVVICVVAFAVIGGLFAYREGKLPFLSADGPIIVQNDGSGSPAKGGGKGAASGPALPVIAERAVSTPNNTVVEAVGTGRSAIGVQLFPPVAGEVKDVLFHAGDEVKTGQVLLILDSAREKLARDLAAVQVRDAKQLLDRYEKARPRGAVSDSEVDEARTALAEARIRLDQAAVDLDDRTILAPFNGMVGIPAVEPGDRIEKTTVITTLDNIDSVLVDFEVSETRFRDVKLGQSVRVETWSLPGEKFDGVVDAIGSRVDPQSRTFSVRARIPNPQGRLRSGMSFAVYIDIAGKSYPAVPEISVLWGDSGTYVWRIEGEKAVRVPVRVVKRTAGRILLDGPVNDGDLIVVEGVQRLRPGRDVAATIRGDDQGIAQRSGSTDGGS